MPPDEAISILRDVPRTKVTVAKEVVRLIGELKTQDAFNELQSFGEIPDLHRDVQIALIRAYWDYLGYEETWALFDKYATSPDEAIAIMVSRIPVTRLPTYFLARFIGVIELLLAHDNVVVRQNTLRRLISSPIADPNHKLQDQILRLIDSEFLYEADSAASALFSMYELSDSDAISHFVQSNQSAYRALDSLFGAFDVYLSQHRNKATQIVKSMLETIKGNPILTVQGVKLAVKGLPFEEIATYLIQIAHDGQLHSDAMAAAQEDLLSIGYQPEAESLGVVEKGLRASDDEHIRRLGLSALDAWAKAPSGWDDEKLQLLEAYRADSSYLVSGAANFIFPPTER